MIRQTILQFVRLYAGLFCCSLSVVLTLRANLGLSPWDVLHQGLSNTLGISFGTANLLVSCLVLLADLLFRQPIGLGSLCNALTIGMMVDGLSALPFLPQSHNLWSGLLLMVLSLPLMAFGTYLYISCEMGAGPRDSLMTAFAKSSIPVGVVRSSMEGAALIAGILLGGQAGIGTVVSVFGLGIALQWVFGAFHFRVADLYHRSVVDSFRLFCGWLHERREVQG